MPRFFIDGQEVPHEKINIGVLSDPSMYVDWLSGPDLSDELHRRLEFERDQAMAKVLDIMR